MDFEYENIFDKIQEILGGSSGNYNILEEQIDINLQMEYFEFSKNQKKKLNPKEILKKREVLFDEKSSIDDIKLLLVQLASLEDVEAYRTIEKYILQKNRPLREWAILALQESRMLLESRLLDENQVFISTGLGGKNSKLRYFIVILSKNRIHFNDIHKKIIESEFVFTLKKYEAEIEEIKFASDFATMLVIIPLKVSIKEIFDEAIKECNQLGNFLDKDFIITNVRSISFDEIRKYLTKRESKKINKKNNI